MSRLATSASGGIAVPRVIVALESSQVLRKQLTLPAAVEENLAQTLAYDLDRHTPFRPEQVYFDAAVIDRDSARKMLRVDWVAALRTVVDEARKRVEAWGAVPIAIVPGPPTTPTRLNLMPHEGRPRQLQWGRWQVWAPLGAIALFACAAVIVPLVQKRQYAIALNGVDAEAAQLAKAAEKVRGQLESTQNDYNFILAKKYAYPSTVHVLDEVTRTLPDDTWLTQLEVKTSGRGKDVVRDVYLRGESGNAGKLVALLEESKLVEQAAPRSPTTKIQGAAGEIFDLGARLRTQPLPAAEQVAFVAAPASVAPAMPARAAAPASAQPVANAPVPAQASAAEPTAPNPSAQSPAAVQRMVAPAEATTDAPAPAMSRAERRAARNAAAPVVGPIPPNYAPQLPTVGPLPPNYVQPQPPRMVPAPPPAAAAPATAPSATVAPLAVPPTTAASAATTMPSQPTTDVPPAPTMPGAVPQPVPQAPPQKDEDE